MELPEVTKELLEIHMDNSKLDNTENTMKETTPKSPKPTITEEEDSEKWKTHMINVPETIEVDKATLLSYFGKLQGTNIR